MNEMFRNLYEKLWRRVGGKPWTDIVREDQKAAPLVYLLIFLALGMLVVRLTGKHWWKILLGFLLGIFVGHFWW